MTNDVDIGVITEKLAALVQPFLGKHEYGHLRHREGMFPQHVLGAYNWELVYEHAGASSTGTSVLYFGDEGRWANCASGSGILYMYKRHGFEKATEHVRFGSQAAVLNRFQREILGIRNKRLSSTRAYPQRFAAFLVAHPERTEGKYTDEELAIIREIAGRKRNHK